MTLEELGQRAVACRYWGWMPGMLIRSTHEGEDIRIDGARNGYPYRQEDFGECFVHGECIPVLSDPATVGCLLALVRQAWRKARIVTAVNPTSTGQHTWRIECDDDGIVDNHTLANLYHFNTEVEALVVALEAAP